MGLDTLRQLYASLVRIRYLELFQKLQRAGVIIPDPDTVYVSRTTEGEITVDQGTVICPGVHLLGRIVIGKNCIVGPNMVLYNIVAGDHVSLGGRPQLFNSVVEDGVKLGTLTEVVRSTIRKGSVVQHMSYLGDTVVGEGVNIGAGTVTANYGGESKKITIIEDGAFIGINTSIVAPVVIGKEGFVGAGAIIRKNIEPHTVVVGQDKVLAGRKSSKTKTGWKIEKE